MKRPGGPDEFFIGYAPPLPTRLSTFITRVVTAGAAGVALAAAAIAAGHVRLDGGTFEFGTVRTSTGTIVTRPYPVLIEDVDGGQRAEGRSGAERPWRLLVATGKHGADALVRGLDGARVTLEGSRIERAGLRMLEVRAGSLTRTDPAAPGPAAPDPAALGVPAAGRPAADRILAGDAVTLHGEIVDSKCFLGVMTPGDGRTHAACASLCLRGGIPPALLVRDRAGRSTLYLLEDPQGASLSAAAADAAGEPLDLRGVVGQRGSWRTLRTDPATWTRPRHDRAAASSKEP